MGTPDELTVGSYPGMRGRKYVAGIGSCYRREDIQPIQSAACLYDMACSATEGVGGWTGLTAFM